MCWSCVREYVAEVGTVTIEGDHVALGPLIRRLYATEWGNTGGPLHVVLDDTNVEDDYVEPEHVAQSVWQWLPWCEVPFTPADYELVRDIAARLYALPTAADRAVAIEEAHAGNPSPVGVMVMVDARWPDNVVLAQRWPR